MCNFEITTSAAHDFTRSKQETSHWVLVFSSSIAVTELLNI